MQLSNEVSFAKKEERQRFVHLLRLPGIKGTFFGRWKAQSHRLIKAKGQGRILMARGQRRKI